MATPTYRSRPRVWLLAFILTVVLHVAAVIGIRITRPFAPAPVEAQAPDPVELVFVDPPRPSPRDEPTRFTELPPDRADEAPPEADLLSNVDSRARDLVEGGEESAPRMEGDSESPQVQIDPRPGAPEPPVPEPEATGVDAEPEPPEALETRSSPEAGGMPSPLEESPVIRRRRPSQPDAFRPPAGSDVYQPEGDAPEADAGLYGDISLNTWAWDYAPWLQRFRRDFVKNWFAPYAYYMGMIHGWTLVEVEISPGGEMLRLDLIEAEGHESLAESSLAAFRSVAPFRPLPAGFPEETLVLRIKLIYPEARRR